MTSSPSRKSRDWKIERPPIVPGSVIVSSEGLIDALTGEVLRTRLSSLRDRSRGRVA